VRERGFSFGSLEVALDADGEVPTQRLWQQGALCFRSRTEVEPGDVNRVAQSVLADAAGSKTRLAACVSSKVSNSLWRTAIDTDRDLANDGLEALQALGECGVNPHCSSERQRGSSVQLQPFRVASDALLLRRQAPRRAVQLVRITS
jgi:hypothetical protein